MPVIVLIGFIFLTGIGLVIAASMQFYMILGEVNSRIEQRNQISPFFVNFRLPQVLERHSEFFPISRARKRLAILLFLGITLFFVSFLAGVIWESR